MINENGIEVTHKQRIWLNSRGERDEEEVFADKDGIYVMMWNGEDGKETKVYLPKDENLKIKRLGNYHQSVEIVKSPK